ncbi:hypothetical protein ACOSP7_013818 [Xanthoceras sorbifolium]
MVRAGITRAVVGIRHLLHHLRGKAVCALRSQVLQVDVLGEDLQSKVIEVFAFVAPKIIGGRNAPTPVGELGMVEMSQALDLIDVYYEQVGPDMLISGFLQSAKHSDKSQLKPMSQVLSARNQVSYTSLLAVVSQLSQQQDVHQSSKSIYVDDPMDLPICRRIQWISLIKGEFVRAVTNLLLLNSMLLSTAGSVLVEASPHDLFWGGGREEECETQLWKTKYIN